VVVRTSGYGSLKNLLRAHKELMSHPTWQPGGHVMADHRNLELSHLRPEDVNSLVTMTQEHRTLLGDGRFAVVLDGDFVFGLGRMWEISAEGKTDLQIRIFKDPEKALLWVSKN